MVGCECRENKGCGGNGETVDGDRINKFTECFLPNSPENVTLPLNAN